MGGIVVLFIAAFIVIAIVSANMRARRRRELAAWARSRGLRFNSGRDDAMEDRFPEFSCLQRGSRRYAYNLIHGEWSGRKTTAFDYHYETSSGDSTTHHHFSAVILGSELPLKELFIRPEGFFDRIKESVGFDDIDFESAEFSRRFYVKARDRKWAYDVIHARTMEFLLSKPEFTIEFGTYSVIAYRSSTFHISEFESAAEVIRGILDRMPEYLRDQLEGRQRR
jgi:hypothetical protein